MLLEAYWACAKATGTASCPTSESRAPWFGSNLDTISEIDSTDWSEQHLTQTRETRIEAQVEL